MDPSPHGGVAQVEFAHAPRASGTPRTSRRASPRAPRGYSTNTAPCMPSAQWKSQ